MTLKLSNRRWLPALLATVLLGGVGTGVLVSTRPANAIIAILIGLREGPIGVGRNQAVLIGLLLPAVQKVQVEKVGVRMRIVDAFSGRELLGGGVTLVRGGPAGYLKVEVMGDGSVRFNGKATNHFVSPNDTLQLSLENIAQAPEGTRILGTAQIHSLAGDGSVVPTDHLSLNFEEIKTQR